MLRQFFKPHSPIQSTSDAKAGLELMKELLEKPGAACPLCKKGTLQLVDNRPDQRLCDKCEEIITIYEINTRFHNTVTYSPPVKALELRTAAARTLYMLCGLVIISSLYAFYSQSWITLIGAGIIIVPIFAQAMMLRYRAWQVENNQLFKIRSPLGKFFRSELRAFAGAPPQPIIEIMPPNSIREDETIIEQEHDNNR